MPFPSARFLLLLFSAWLVHWVFLRSPRARLAFLLASSYAFYLAWDARDVAVPAAVTLISYWAVAWSSRPGGFPAAGRWAPAAAVAALAGGLAFFKLRGALLNDPRVGLPLGVSFFTFGAISYVVDCASGRDAPCARLDDYALFVSFFPHLASGPIIRSRQFLSQLTELRELDGGSTRLGLASLAIGLVKKLAVADRLAPFVDQAFSAPAAYSRAGMAGALLALAAQVYFDFSGYTDMAIGAARLFGLRLPQNFDSPYMARDVGEFWTRWHMSLTAWLRDYVYVPLRGALPGSSSASLAVALTILVGALWHGARATVLLFGAYHAALLLGHRLLRATGGPRLPPAVGRALTFCLVCVGWALMRAPTCGDALEVLRSLALPMGSLSAPAFAWGAGALVLGYDLGGWWWRERRSERLAEALAAAPGAARLAAYAAAALVLLLSLPRPARPFIYVRF